MKRTDPPFFARANTRQAIADVAGSRSLVIYVGAGVTVDNSRLTWLTLVERLARRIKIGEDEIARLRESVPAVVFGSIVAERYRKRYPKHHVHQLVLALRDELYGESEWRNGQFAVTTMLLCIALLDVGADVIIVTTNYDIYLEEAVQQCAAKLPGRQMPTVEVDALTTNGEASDATQPSTDEPEQTSTPATNVLPLQHIHGIVGQSDQPELDDYVVFTERNFSESEQSVWQVLQGYFSDRDVLILGSGLDDAPLVRALSLTAETVKAGRRRWAIYPRQGLDDSADAYRGPLESAADFMTLAQSRADQLGLTLVTPDFYGQAGQFPREVAALVEHSRINGGTDYRQLVEDQNYMTRLAQWSKSWHDSRKADMEAAQHEAHQDLRDFVPVARSILGDQQESLKVEMWIRWTADDRELALWASSTGSWPDSTTMRRIAIRADSKWAAMRAFCNGSAELMKRSEVSDGDRWTTYLAIPVRVGDVMSSTAVGVISIATQKSIGSRLNEDDTEALTPLCEALEELGRQLCAPRVPTGAV